MSALMRAPSKPGIDWFVSAADRSRYPGPKIECWKVLGKLATEHEARKRLARVITTSLSEAFEKGADPRYLVWLTLTQGDSAHPWLLARINTPHVFQGQVILVLG